MNKEIRNYQESVFFGLNLRQCICSVLAVIAAVVIYFGTSRILFDEIRGWLCMLGAIPFAFCGFFKYHGMTAEQFLWAFIKSEILYPKRLAFRPENLYYSCMEEMFRTGKKTRRDRAVKMKKRKYKKQKEGGCL